VALDVPASSSDADTGLEEVVEHHVPDASPMAVRADGLSPRILIASLVLFLTALAAFGRLEGNFAEES
jgi:hypothetical protein